MLVSHTLLYLYFIGVLFLTLMPFLSSLPSIFAHPYNPMNLKPFQDYLNGWGDPLRQIILNVLMLVPFGLLFPVCRRSRGKKCGFLRVFLCTFAISLSIELLQPLIIAHRSSDITDLITNTVGGILGYLLYLPFRKPISRLLESK